MIDSRMPRVGRGVEVGEVLQEELTEEDKVNISSVPNLMTDDVFIHENQKFGRKSKKVSSLPTPQQEPSQIVS